MNGEGWAGSGCGEVFVATWLPSFWGGGGESLTAWAVTTASYRVAEQVGLELSVIGRSEGQRFEKMRIGVDLWSEYIKSRGYVVWFREIQIARTRKLWFDESRIKMLKRGKCENQISILTYDIIVPLGNHIDQKSEVVASTMDLSFWYGGWGVTYKTTTLTFKSIWE